MHMFNQPATDSKARGRFADWVRKTTTSFAELLQAPERQEATDAGGGLIYKLRHWPSLPHASKTAEIYRTLSVMSHRPVNRHWILSTSGLKPVQVDRLLQMLADQEALETIDASAFPASHPDTLS